MKKLGGHRKERPAGDGEVAKPPFLREPNFTNVTATDNSDQIAPFAAFGKSTVDIAAPGLNIFSLVLGRPNVIGTATGTSFATPFVAGTMALMISHDPTLKGDAQLVRARLLLGADRVPIPTVGGRLNVAGALR